MDLDAVVCSGSKALIYIKSVTHYNHRNEDSLHKELWNQDLAPVLLIVDPTEVRVYSARPLVPTPEGAPRYIEALSLAENALRAHFLVGSMQSGEYFSLQAQHFNRKSSVDRTLLRTLSALRDDLHNLDQRIGHDRLHRLLICTIFIRYLIDRGSIRPQYLTSRTGHNNCGSISNFLNTFPEGRSAAFLQLFSIVGEDLGGDLLSETARELNERPLRDEHFCLLQEFLEGTTQGQLALDPRWVYDLSFIPTETISAIYQEFLAVEVEDAKHKLGTVATPKHLAELMVDLTIAPELFNGQGRILDPACGSGVFLVTVFNRLAFALRASAPKTGLENARALTKTLQRRFFGIDINATSCYLTALNLVHALLSQLSDDELYQVLQRKGRLVPPLFLNSPKSVSNIQKENFLRRQPRPDYELIIGNPPWSKTGDVPNEFGPPNLTKSVPARGNLAHHFALLAPMSLTNSGMCCLLLDAKAMLASANGVEFTREWFSTYRVETIVNLTNLRSFLFETAGRAGAIFCVRKEPPTRDSIITYRVPLPARSTKHIGILDAAPCPSFRVSYNEILAPDRDILRVWKMRQWGTARDIRFIERLETITTLKEFLASRRAELHQGFNIHGGSGDYEEHEILGKIPYLPSDRMERGEWSLVLPPQLFCRPYGERPREEKLVRQWVSDEARMFGGPRIIIHHSAVSNPPGIRAAVATGKFSFHKEILALYFTQNGDASYLHALAGILCSPLVGYYLFHTSSSWGVESQPQVRVKTDLWRLPIPDLTSGLAKQLATVVKAAVERATGSRRLSEYHEIIEEYREQIEGLVFDLYDLDEAERMLIQHFRSVTVLSAEFSEDRESKLDSMPSAEDRQEYLAELLKAIFAWTGERVGLEARAVISAETGLCLIEVSITKPPGWKILPEIRGSSEFEARIRQIAALLRKKDVVLPSFRNLLIFDGASLFLTRPLMARFWTHASALTDADHVVSRLISGRTVH